MRLFSIAFVYERPDGEAIRVEALAQAVDQTGAVALCFQHVATLPGCRFLHVESWDQLVLPRLTVLSSSVCPN